MPSTLRPPDQPRPDLLLSLPALRAKLEEQRQFRTEQITALTAGGEPVAVPAMRAGTDPDSAYQQVSAALLTGARQALADIDAALYRMLVGRYGICQRCGAQIALRRLYAIPQAALCTECHRGSDAGGAGRGRRSPA
jgi:RNA polymerase-binding transcription factor DksA